MPQGSGIALLAEFKANWPVSAGWLIGYAQTLEASGFVPGFIGNVSGYFNCDFSNPAHKRENVMRRLDECGAVYCATEPKQGGEPEWLPICPPFLVPHDIGLWRLGEIGLNRVSADGTYARDGSLLNCMWQC